MKIIDKIKSVIKTEKGNFKKDPKNISIGKIGEEVAFLYLKNNGYKVIERNYRKKYGEIDIIAKSKNEILVFVEVKTFATEVEKNENENFLKPEDNLTKGKLKKLQNICNNYANGNGNKKLINEKNGWQIDLLAITIPKKEIEKEEINMREIYHQSAINHYENIF